MDLHTHAHMCPCTCIHTYAHTCEYTRANMYTHIKIGGKGFIVSYPSTVTLSGLLPLALGPVVSQSSWELLVEIGLPHDCWEAKRRQTIPPTLDPQ